jgi:hypothetical protein
MFNIIKKKIDSYVTDIFKREIANLFKKDGDVYLDHHLKSESWAVIKLDKDEHTCYLKFVDLGKQDLKTIMEFLHQFERPHIDSAPHVEQYFKNLFYNEDI